MQEKLNGHAVWNGRAPEVDDATHDCRFVESAVGVPSKPQVAIATTRENRTDYGIRRQLNRTPVFGGIRIVTERTALEMATDKIFRPEDHVLEVGPYPEADYPHIADRIRANDGQLKHNGAQIDLQGKSKIHYIRGLARSVGIGRVAFHNMDSRLFEIAQEAGLEPRERLETYDELGGKTSLMQALIQFRSAHPGTSLSVFGRSFQNLGEAEEEIARLREAGVGAYIKRDSNGDDGPFLTGGVGHLSLPREMDPSEVAIRTQELLGGQKDAPVAGVVQMNLPDSRVISVTSGQRGEGYEVYETHVDKFHQRAGSSQAPEIAVPIGSNRHQAFLIESLWPALQAFYRENRIKGGQNMDFLVIPPKELELARMLYGDPHMPELVPSDLNPRPVTGTKTHQGRFIQETHRPNNIRRFATREIMLSRETAANPHRIVAAAAEIGLVFGRKGNTSVTNWGRLTPDVIRTPSTDRPLAVQVYVQDTRDPVREIDMLEDMLAPENDRTAVVFDRGIKPINPDQVTNGSAYKELVYRNMLGMMYLPK